MASNGRHRILSFAIHALFLGAFLSPSAPGGTGAANPTTAREYLDALVYTREEVDQWLSGRGFPFCRYEAELGWLVLPMRRRDGAGGSVCTYNYDGPLGARRLINATDRPGRINTFGDSFTQGDQVSDGETWQEQLAAHLGEPVRNYGVGGYSVYQAYLRMQRVERELPARLIIINIFEDDHYRNLDAWRNIRVKKHPLFIEPTLPYLRVDLATDECVEVGNPCPTPESVYNLADPEWVYRRFKDDFVLGILLAHRNAGKGDAGAISRVVMDRANAIGINTRVDEGATIANAANALHTRAALRATRFVLERVEADARREGKRVLYVLSYRARSITHRLQGGTRFDQELIDYLVGNRLNFVDLMEAHAADFKGHAVSPADYVARHYIGHYNAAGNDFTARAIKDHVVKLLDPPPPAYDFQVEGRD